MGFVSAKVEDVVVMQSGLTQELLQTATRCRPATHCALPVDDE